MSKQEKQAAGAHFWADFKTNKRTLIFLLNEEQVLQWFIDHGYAFSSIEEVKECL